MQRSYIPSFYFYKFANAIADSYTNLQAYGAGAIDENGNILSNEANIDPFEYFVIKLKKIFEQLPPGTTKHKLHTLMGITQLFSEEVESIGISSEQVTCLIEAHVSYVTNNELSYIELLEDMTTGGIAGGLGTPAEAPGANKGNVSGYDPVMAPMQSRSSPVNMIDAIEMFTLPSSEFNIIKKTKSYPKTQIGNYLKRFGYRNNQSKIAIKNEETGEIYWVSNKIKNSAF
jgi:hypothetical protein